MGNYDAHKATAQNARGTKTVLIVDTRTDTKGNTTTTTSTTTGPKPR